VKRLLFICSQNQLRSPTAEQVFSTWPGIECASAGTNNDANTPLCPELIEWADVIFVMENTHRDKVRQKYQAYLADKRIICLHIPDQYRYMDPILVRLLESRVGKFLR
jgi:predicted protein tyrosine phosphatase